MSKTRILNPSKKENISMNKRGMLSHSVKKTNLSYVSYLMLFGDY